MDFKLLALTVGYKSIIRCTLQITTTMRYSLLSFHHVKFNKKITFLVRPYILEYRQYKYIDR